MTSFDNLRAICQKNRMVSAEVIDNYLIYYAARQNKLDQEMDQLAKPYKHILRKLPEGTDRFFKSQYIAHRIFKKDGLIHKYLRHSELQYLELSQQEYLKKMAEYPWRFSFSEIIRRPEDDFFQMEDVFTTESYLLYSPGMTTILRECHPLLWFNLIGYNGFCWQSFGPIAYYTGFQADDIYFFATEMRPGIGSEEELAADVERNPVPYMMLLSGAEIPLLFKKEEQIIYLRTECENCSPDQAAMEKDFIINHAGLVTRYGLKRWNVFPHYSCAYYDERQRSLLLSSMTEKGYAKLVDTLKKYGIPAPNVPDIGVNPPMVVVTEDILRKKVDLDVYAHLFTEEPSVKEKESTDKMNALLQMLTADINAGREPDYELLAKKSGQDIETIKDIVKYLNETLKRMGK